MTDREKVINGLQIERECVSRDCDRDCGNCDLVQDRDWLLSVYDNALELLKEQEPVKPVRFQPGTGNPMLKCGGCLEDLKSIYNYCPWCGRKLNWE